MPAAELLDRVAALEARLDARRVKQAPGQLGLILGAGEGQPCGNSHISPTFTCWKGKGGARPAKAAPAETARTAETSAAAPLPDFVAAAVSGAEVRKEQLQKELTAAREQLAKPGGAGLQITAPNDFPDEKALPLVDGRPPAKRLGSGAFGDTYLFNLKDGTQAVVKVDRLSNLDPLADFSTEGVTGEEERMLMAQRELKMLTAAAAAGVAPQPLSQAVTRLPDGRFAFGYRFQPGAPLCKDHTTLDLTPEARAILEKPGAMGRFATGLATMARAAGAAGLDHRDEHGGNMLLLEDGTPQLLDWAMARHTPTNPDHQGVTEARLVRAFGGIVGVTRTAPGSKPSIDGFLTSAGKQASNATTADVDVIADWWVQQPEGGRLALVPGEGTRLPADERRRRQQAAHEIKRANPGRHFMWSEIEAGLMPMPPQDVLTAAQAARDREFGAERLRRMRRTIDGHMARWEGFP